MSKIAVFVFSALFSMHAMACHIEVREVVNDMAANGCKVLSQSTPESVILGAGMYAMGLDGLSLQTSDGFMAAVFTYTCKNSNTALAGLVSYKQLTTPNQAIPLTQYVHGDCIFSGPVASGAEKAL